jgi:hypothetical protein
MSLYQKQQAFSLCFLRLCYGFTVLFAPDSDTCFKRASTMSIIELITTCSVTRDADRQER